MSNNKDKKNKNRKMDGSKSSKNMSKSINLDDSEETPLVGRKSIKASDFLKDLYSEKNDVDEQDFLSTNANGKNNKKYSCKKCNFVTDNPHTYSSHSRSHLKKPKNQKKIVQKSDELQVFDCDECDFSTTLLHGLRIHITKKHVMGANKKTKEIPLREELPSKTFKCRKCDYVGTNRHSYSSHFKTHNKNKKTDKNKKGGVHTDSQKLDSLDEECQDDQNDFDDDILMSVQESKNVHKLKHKLSECYDVIDFDGDDEKDTKNNTKNNKSKKSKKRKIEELDDEAKNSETLKNGKEIWFVGTSNGTKRRKIETKSSETSTKVHEVTPKLQLNEDDIDDEDDIDIDDQDIEDKGKLIRIPDETSHRFSKENIQDLKVMNETFNCAQYDEDVISLIPETHHPKIKNSTMSSSYNLTKKEDDDKEDIDNDDEDDEYQDAKEDFEMGTNPDIAHSDVYDDFYETEVGKKTFESDNYNFADVSLVSSVCGKPSIMLFNVTGARKFPIYCYRLLKTIRVKILTKKQAVYHASLCGQLRFEEFKNNPDIFRPEEITLESSSSTDSKKSISKTSDVEIDFYRQTGNKVTKMYYDSRIDAISKREMFNDPTFSMSSYPNICWGFDFSLIFNFLRTKDDRVFTKYVDSFDSSKFVMTILSLYPSLEEQECILVESIKSSMKNRRRYKLNNPNDDVSETDDVEEVYSISDVISVEDENQPGGQKENVQVDESKLLKKRVKYWMEIFLPRIDFKQFKDSSPQEPIKHGISEADDMRTEYEISDKSSNPKMYKGKKPGGHVIYHKFRVLPVVLLPFFVDTLIGHKKIQNSATNLVFRLIEQLKKFRNSVVSGNVYSDYENDIPLFLNGHNISSYSGMTYETASLDATILQLETNFERLLFSIHSRSIEIQQLAQSLAYDTRDSISLLFKASNKLHLKTLSINSKIKRLDIKHSKKIDSLVENKNTESNVATMNMNRLWSAVKKLQEDVIKLEKENEELKTVVKDYEENTFVQHCED